MFIVIEGDTYYITNNTIVYRYQIIDNQIYYFGDDGKMNRDTTVDDNYFGPDGYIMGDQVFIIIEGDTYYITNNTVVYRYQIINHQIYYFGDDGKMNRDTTVDDNYFGPDGYIMGDQVFIIIEGDTYYITNNTVVYDYQFINNKIYYFGDDGKMNRDTTVDDNHIGSDGYIIGDRVFIIIEGDTYYITSNTVVYDYQFINNKIYYFGDDGKMNTNTTVGGNYFGPNGYIVGDREFIIIEGDTYYIINSTVVYDYQFINNKIYYFGDDGKMNTNTTVGGNYFGPNGYIVGDREFIIIEGDTYYITNNTVVYDYQFINNKIYYFDRKGQMLIDEYYDGYYFGVNGFIIVEEATFITIDSIVYWVMTNGDAYVAITVSGVVTESDHDYDSSNNVLLGGVQCIATVGGKTFTCVTDANGFFRFDKLPVGEITFKFTKNGYYGVNKVITSTQDEELTIVMDLEVSNTLSGRVMIADADTNYSNNRPLANALVTIKRVSSTNSFYYECRTDANGEYQFVGLTAGVYTITVTREGYIPVEQTLTVRHNEATIQNLVIEAIDKVNVSNGYASGTISDARTGLTVPNLTLLIRNGIGNTTGDVIMTLTTNSSGYYITGALAPGNYTVQVVDQRSLIVEDDRYGTVVFTIKVMSNTTIKNQNATTSNSVGISADSIRIVLTWGSTPSDLDSHLYANMVSGADYHIYYSEKTYSSDAKLDVDDTSAYGPETTTISKIRDGVYKFYVHDYSGKANSSSANLKNSGACVKVYLGSAAVPAYTFYAPDGLGTYWHVFTYDSTTGDFVVVNTISNHSGY